MSNNQSLEMMRRAFKTFNKLMLLNWRLGLGRWLSFWPRGLGRFMVIAHTGCKTGMMRHTPVNYAVIDGEVHCTAGFGSVSDWYRNIQAHPTIELWLPDGRWSAYAEDITESDDALTKLRTVLVNSGFAAFAAGINPYTMSDDELAVRTADYRLLRLRRVTRQSSPHVPGDLVWVWGVLAIVLVLWLLRPRPAIR